jgi:ABC-type Zn uptake system ZnuABC Zn-binding protein ZnuA
VRAAALAGGAAVLAVALVGCGGKPTADSDWPDKPGPKVATSFAPLYCFAANVAGDDATVKNVMTTTGPHDFDPTEKDARLVSKADLLFLVGLELDDDKADKIKTGSGNANLSLVKLGEAVPKDKRCEGHCEHAHHGPDHQHGDDPHVWLSPDLAILMVNKVRDTFKERDPARAAGYDGRAAAYVKKLQDLKTYGVEKFKGKKDNRLVSFHDSLAYFEKCYGLEIRGVLTQKAGQEPDEKQMKKLIRICADDNKPTRVIAVEPQYATSTSGETLRKELANKGVKNPVLVEIDTLETVKPADLTLDWYEKRMRANIDALAAALE